jgi:CubicO group peptidase (beta-lactamase class C family)
MRSVGKSLTALAVGIAIADGAISDIDTPVFSVFADYVPIAHDGAVKQATTLRDLLTLRSPLLCDDWQDSPGNENRMYRTRNWTRFALDIPVDPDLAARGPGYSRFSYCTAGVFLVGQMLERKTGVRFDQFVGDRIFAPLGISEVEWTTSSIGEIQSGGQISLRARDAERLGRLVLNDGQWNGQQIVPRAWITEMVEPVSAPAPGLSYGYLWWISSFRVGDTEQDFDAVLMLGNGGNLVVVIPALDVVVVVQAQNYNDPADLTLSRAIVERFILPALIDPLAVD